MQAEVDDIADAAIADFARYLHTGMPCRVLKWDGGQLVTVRPMVRFVDIDGTVINFPDLPDVLVQYPGGGGFVLTFPIAAGDECFVTFSQRCIDAWYATGDVGEVLSLRTHDLSDGFAHFGFNSAPKVITSVDADAIALRTKAGAAFLKIKADGTIIIDGTKLIVKCPAELEDTQLVMGAVTMQSTQQVTGQITGQGGLAVSGGSGATVEGNLAQTGGSYTTDGDVTAGTVSLKGHVHSNPEGGNVGPAT